MEFQSDFEMGAGKMSWACMVAAGRGRHCRETDCLLKALEQPKQSLSNCFSLWIFTFIVVDPYLSINLEYPTVTPLML